MMMLQVSASAAVSMCLMYLLWAIVYFYQAWRERKRRQSRGLSFDQRMLG